MVVVVVATGWGGCVIAVGKLMVEVCKELGGGAYMATPTSKYLEPSAWTAVGLLRGSHWSRPIISWTPSSVAFGMSVRRLVGTMTGNLKFMAAASLRPSGQVVWSITTQK